MNVNAIRLGMIMASFVSDSVKENLFRGNEILTVS